MSNITFETAIPISVDVPITANFNEANGYVHYFISTNLDPTKMYEVYTESGEDLYGKVYDSNRYLLDQDDDNGPGNNPRITNIRNVNSIFIEISGYGGSQVAGEYKVYLKEVPIIYVTSITFQQNKLELSMGDRYGQSVFYSVTPYDASDKSVTWSSSDVSIVEVDGYGKVRPVAPGVATVTCTANLGGVSATCEITVIPIPTVSVTGIEMQEKNIDILITEGNKSLHGQIIPYDATNFNKTWSSSDESVLKVHNYGFLEPVSVGTAIITCTTEDGGFSDTCVVNVVPVPTFSGGSGTEEDPYLIGTPKDLEDIRYLSKSYYAQTTNLDLSNYTNWVPLPDFSESQYDGRNFTISNLTINKPDGNGVGLFSTINYQAVLKNINIVNCNVTGKSDVGSLVGDNRATIYNCHANGVVTGESRIGGLSGSSSYGDIDRSSTNVTVTGTVDNAGGVVGYLGGGEIKNSYSLGDVAGDSNVGGIVGTVRSGKAITSYSKSNVLGNSSVGGIAGKTESGITLDGCIALNPSVQLRGTTNLMIGMITSYHSRPNNIISCKYLSSSTRPNFSSDYGSPITLDESKIIDTYAISGWDCFGIWNINNGDQKLFQLGEVKGDGTEENPYEVKDANDLRAVERSSNSCFIQTNHIDLSSYSNWEPLAAKFSDLTYTINYNGNNFEIRNLSCSNNTNNIGLFSSARFAKISNLKLTNVNINCPTSSNVGALIGKSLDGLIEDCSVEGVIKGENRVGGLVGNTKDFNLNSCSFIGDVTGKDTVGGVLGGQTTIDFPPQDYDESFGVIKKCSVSGNITGVSKVGGIIGTGNVATKCKFIGTVTGSNSYVGSIGGKLSYTSFNIISNGTVSGENFTGGVVGEGEVEDSYYTGDVNGVNNVGGVSGKGSALRCKFNGTINGTSIVGGIVGDGSVENSYALGAITGTNNIGGVVGISSNVTNSYSSCDITGVDKVGGIVGELVGTEIDLKNLINLNKSINGTTNVGTIFGLSSIDVSNLIVTCLSLNSTISNNNSIAIQGMSINETQSKQKLTYYNLMDFLDVWSIKEGQSTPILVKEFPNDKGSGTQLDPYLIVSVEDLYKIRHSLDSYYKQIADIDLSTWGNWTPIGNGQLHHRTNDEEVFSGFFDGNGFSIKNLEISTVVTDDYEEFFHYGLFGKVAGDKKKRAQIQNIKLENIQAEFSQAIRVGTLAGHIQYTNVHGCVVNGTIENNYVNTMGGLIGAAENSTITTSSVICDFSADPNTLGVGGLIGSSEYVDIENCKVETNLLSFANYIGGITSQLRNGAIKNCSVKSNISSTNRYAGGIVAVCIRSSLIDCNFTGDITNRGDLTGGIAGEVVESSFTRCNSIGNIQANEYVGGLIGNYSGDRLDSTMKLVDCSSRGSVSGRDYVGGLIGSSMIFAINNSYSEGNVTGSGEIIGGLIGHLQHSVLTNCYSKGDVGGQDQFIGGFVGNSNSSNITDCYSIGNVNIPIESTDSSLIGGFAGSFEFGLIINSYSEGNVVGGNHTIGGFIGSANGVEITGSYSLGDVTNGSNLDSNYYGTRSVGGFIGSLNSGIILKCYSKGNVIGGETFTGGLMGMCLSSSITDTFHIGNVNGLYFVGGLAGIASWSLFLNNYSSGNIEGQYCVGGLIGSFEEYIEVISCFVLDGKISSIVNPCGIIYVDMPQDESPGSPIIVNEANISNCYYISTIDVPENAVVQGLSMTPEESKRKSIYESVGWKFDNVWGIDEGTSFPYFYIVKEEPAPEIKLGWTMPWTNPSNGGNVVDQTTYRNIYTRVEVDKRISESKEIAELKAQIQELRDYIETVLND